jgi:glucuronate isomerase
MAAMSTMTSKLSAALLPADDRTRDLALELYGEVAEAPIISPHGHVDPELLLHDQPFSDPTDLFITRDHYITRLLFAAGVSFAEFGRDPRVSTDPRAAWGVLAAHWHRFAGTASGYWLQDALARLPSAGTVLPVRHRGARHHRRSS